MLQLSFSLSLKLVPKLWSIVNGIEKLRYFAGIRTCCNPREKRELSIRKARIGDESASDSSICRTKRRWSTQPDELDTLHLEFNLRIVRRKALFYVRVFSGYEERRIRFVWLQLEKHIQQAQARKAAINKVPEQIILAEEAAIEEYFKPIDKEAEFIMKMQLDGEEKTMKQIMKAMQQQALLEKAEAERVASRHKLDESESNIHKQP